MLRNGLITKERSLTMLACVASVVLLASCSSSGDSGGGTGTGPIITETTTGTGTTGGTGTGTITGGTGTGGTGTVTGGTGTGGTGTVTGGTGTGGTGTVTGGTGTGGTGTVTGGTGTGGEVDTSSNLIGFYQLDRLDLTNDTEPAVAVPPGFGYLDIGQLDDNRLSFILMLLDTDLNCIEPVVVTPIVSTGGGNFEDAVGDSFSITQSGSTVTVTIEPLVMDFSPAVGITFTDLQLCGFE